MLLGKHEMRTEEAQSLTRNQTAPRARIQNSAPVMESTSIFSKSPQPHECDPNRSPTFGHHPEEPSQAKIASPKLPPEAPRETKVETIKSPGRKLSELLREREQEWTAVARKTGPLRLLDLPLDLLTQILREVC